MAKIQDVPGARPVARMRDLGGFANFRRRAKQNGWVDITLQRDFWSERFSQRRRDRRANPRSAP